MIFALVGFFVFLYINFYINLSKKKDENIDAVADGNDVHDEKFLNTGREKSYKRDTHTVQHTHTSLERVCFLTCP